ncbi:transcription factor Tfb4 [Metschnikowia bicuspidata]|uniref:General transcription and DNA repair factor IIH subunit TFB4 n=1 Tax=Metschnikowia bicuspidata TaxID=27322 RepID=A0A4P9ZGJ1_9ASCO|nr:transcription factor Tfb4 [Metschnikowia bicuspidata]
MDAIAETVFKDLSPTDDVAENPSLLTVVFEISPASWYSLRNQISIQDAIKALVVFLNTHLSLNNSNQVAFIAALPAGTRMLYPNVARSDSEPPLVNAGMYRHFRLVDDTVLREINRELEQLLALGALPTAFSLSGALLLALTYTNRMLHVDLSISTTTASAISSTTSAAAMSGRILAVTANDAHDNNYISIMNSMFAAQKMLVPIDVVKLGTRDSPYMQQAADATNGVYLHNREPRGLIQTLSTAYFVEPCLRGLVILPTSANVDYKASCFVTGRPVDIGYVCSVCLCILSTIPELDTCPVCKSKFDGAMVARLRQGSVLARKKRKVGEKQKEKQED